MGEELNLEIEKESELEGLDKSENLRRLIQEATNKIKIDRAITAYLNGILGISSVSIEANLSVQHTTQKRMPLLFPLS